MFSSITSNISSLCSGSLGVLGRMRQRVYISGGSSDGGEPEQLGLDNDPFLRSGHSEFNDDLRRDLVSSVPGVQEVCSHLGSGSFGHVWECRVEERPGRVAVKVFRDEHTREQARELQLHARLQHPNLVQLFEAIGGVPSAILMELCSGGNLARLIHGPEQREAFSQISIHARVQAALDVLACIQYLHANNILHRDVKPSNCLLSSVHEVHAEWIPQVKLGDLGLARQAAPAMSKRVGTLIYMAPELMEGDDYSFPVDIYSCAMLIYELYTGMVPFSTSDQRLHNDVAFILSVSRGERPRLDHLLRDAAGEAVRDILQASWSDEPASRPTAEGLAERLRSLPTLL